MENKWQIKINNDFGPRLDKEVFFFRNVNHGGIPKVEVMYSDTIKTVDPGSAGITPSFRFTQEMLQDFANALDKMGIKPQRGFLEGKLEAQEKHLEDMRTLVFKK